MGGNKTQQAAITKNCLPPHPHKQKCFPLTHKAHTQGSQLLHKTLQQSCSLQVTVSSSHKAYQAIPVAESNWDSPVQLKNKVPNQQQQQKCSTKGFSRMFSRHPLREYLAVLCNATFKRCQVLLLIKQFCDPQGGHIWSQDEILKRKGTNRRGRE